VVHPSRMWDPSLYGLDGLMDMMGGGCVYFTTARPGGASREISGALEREGRGECCDYSEISMW
jgi:hypothetical protein